MTVFGYSLYRNKKLITYYPPTHLREALRDFKLTYENYPGDDVSLVESRQEVKEYVLVDDDSMAFEPDSIENIIKERGL